MPQSILALYFCISGGYTEAQQDCYNGTLGIIRVGNRGGGYTNQNPKQEITFAYQLESKIRKKIGM